MSYESGPGAYMQEKAVHSNVREQDPVLAEIVRRLIDKFSPEKIYLFGSRARGTATLQSDYDLLIVLSEKAEPSYRLSQKAHELLSDLPYAKDILFTSLNKFEKRKNVIGALAEIAHSEGRALYAA